MVFTMLLRLRYIVHVHVQWVIRACGTRWFYRQNGAGEIFEFCLRRSTLGYEHKIIRGGPVHLYLWGHNILFNALKTVAVLVKYIFEKP